MHSTTPPRVVRPFLRRALLSTTIIAGMTGLAMPGTYAQTIEWTGNASGDWFDANNWDLVATPGSTSDVIIDANTNETFLDNGQTVDVNGLIVGDTGTAKLNIENGSILNTMGSLAVGPAYYIFAGRNSGSNGTIIVTGPGSQFNVTGGGNLTVGDFGSGMLHILNGGSVTSNNGNLGADEGNDYNGTFGRGSGSAWVDGSGSRWDMSGSLWVGDNGDGDLTISDGGVVTTASKVTVGNGTPGIGSILVTGTGSQLRVGYLLQLGFRGMSTLTISDYGLVSVNNGTGTIELGRITASDSTINIGAASGDPAAAPGTLEAGLIEFWKGSASSPLTITFNHTDMTGEYEFNPDLAYRTGKTPNTTPLIMHENGHTNLNGDASG